ncbi:hypothetical protein VTK56DRAFT_1223 [Thermocarpiscus australiensis]
MGQEPSKKASNADNQPHHDLKNLPSNRSTKEDKKTTLSSTKTGPDKDKTAKDKKPETPEQTLEFLTKFIGPQ